MEATSPQVAIDALDASGSVADVVFVRKGGDAGGSKAGQQPAQGRDISTPGVGRVGTPCGDELHHYLCRQVGFCVFGETPKGMVANGTDWLNAILMALSFWWFVTFAVAAAGMYRREYYRPLTASIPDLHKVWSVALIVNGVLCLFPTYYSIIQCNIFKAKVIANQTWNIVNVWASILFFSLSFEGYAFMMFAMGWSVAMFTVTARGSWNTLPGVGTVPLAYAAAVLFVALTPAFAAVEDMADARSTGFYFCFAAANWFLGFTVWSSMEGYAHVHQWAIYPDVRLWQWTGPTTLQVPLSKEVPSAWASS